MSENMSIDDIIKQAEEIRLRSVKMAQDAVEQKKDEPKLEEDVKPFTPHSSDKTAVVDSKELKKATEQKTQVVDTEKTILMPNQVKKVSDKTAVVPKPDSRQKSFFNNNETGEPIYSKAPPEIIERPATIKSKSRLDHTSDLEEIPTIVAVDELDNTKISFSSARAKAEDNSYDSDEDDQIVLEGFEDSTDNVSKIDEDVAEEQLKRRREEKVNKFRLFSPDDISQDKEPSVKKDYTPSDDKSVFMDKLLASKSSFTLRAIISIAIAIPLLILNVFKDNPYLPNFLLDYSVNYTFQLVLYVIAMIVNLKNITYGFKIKNKINYSTPITIASIIVLIHSIFIAFNDDFTYDGIALMLVMVFAFVMTNIGKRALIERIITNFDFLVSQKDKHTVEAIVNTVDATIISRGVLTGEPNLKTSIKTDFSTNFLDISCSDEPADSIAKTTGSIMLGLSALLFIVMSIVKSDWYFGFNVACCAMCISLPVISIFNTNMALLGASKLLNKNGAMINGFEGAAMVNDANAIVLEAQDLFGRNSCEIHGIKTFNGAKADEVILQTAAVIMKTKSPLSYVFDDVIVGKQTILPDVDDVVYEDRLGTSAWIYRKKILVGTRDLLIHHGVPVPKEEFEQKYTRKNRKILYLAVAGKVMAMFVVSYSADPDLKRNLRKLEKSGMTMLVKSADPFINDDSIAELFGLPSGFVRVMNTSNARAFEKYSNMCVEKSPAYVVHNGSALAFVSSMAAADSIVEMKKLLTVLISFGSAMGFVLVTMLGFIDAITQISPTNIVIFQLIWCVFVELVSKIKRSGL